MGLIPGLKLAAEFSPNYSNESLENTQFSLDGNNNEGKKYYANGYGLKVQAFWQLGTDDKSWDERPAHTFLLAAGLKYRYRDLEAIDTNLGGGDETFASHQVGVEVDATYYPYKMTGFEAFFGGGLLLWRGTMSPGVAALYELTGDDDRNQGYLNAGVGFVFRPASFLGVRAAYEYTLPIGSMSVSGVETNTDWKINDGGGWHAIGISLEGYLDISAW